MEPAISCCFSYSQVTNQRHLLFSDKMSEIVTNKKIGFFSDVISAPSEDEAASVGAKSDSDDSSSDE